MQTRSLTRFDRFKQIKVQSRVVGGGGIHEQDTAQDPTAFRDGEAVLVTLVIFSLHDLLTPEGHSLKTLILPGSILILTLSLFLMRRKEKE